MPFQPYHPKTTALQYDGTNATEITDFLTSIGCTSFIVETTIVAIDLPLPGIHPNDWLVWQEDVLVIKSNALFSPGFAPGIGAIPMLRSAATRALNTPFIVSADRDAIVSYVVAIASDITLTGGESGNVFFEVSQDGSTGWTEYGRFENANTGTVVIGISTTDTKAGELGGFIKAGWSARLRTATVTGSPTFTYRSGEEILN